MSLNIIPKCPKCGSYDLMVVEHDIYQGTPVFVQCGCGCIVREMEELRK